MIYYFLKVSKSMKTNTDSVKRPDALKELERSVYQPLVWREDLQMYSAFAKPAPAGVALPASSPFYIEAVYGLSLAQREAQRLREYGYIAILQRIDR